jgi:phytoene dehydrogenase-like protein
MAFDVIVLGAGQNGLAAAVRLGQAGRRVLVVERRWMPGGLAAAEEIHPGYTVPGALHDTGLVRRETVRRLGLDRHGLGFRPAPPVYLAEEGEAGILLHRDPRAAAPALAARSARDAAAYERYRAFLARITPLLQGILGDAPPPLVPSGIADFWGLARRGLGALKLGRKDTVELARVAPMCVADFLNERFETPLLVEALAAPAVAASFAGPWSSGTATNLLLGEHGSGEQIRGGPPALIAALLAAARAAGVEIRADAPVGKIRTAVGRVTGVELANGEAIDAPVVVSTCDPKQTFLRLLPPGELPIAVEQEFRNLRCRGTAAKLHLALSGPLELAARPAGSAGSTGSKDALEAISIGGGHVDELERAYDAVKYRAFSPRPHLDIRIPSIADPSLAPPGCAVVSVLASFAAYDLEGGWTDARREDLGEAVLQQLERHSPAIRQKIVAAEVLTPVDLEQRYGVTGGHLHHVEPALDQLLFLRPAASAARYATAVPGLFLGGSGSHPGGGLNPTPGLLAADAVLSA